MMHRVSEYRKAVVALLLAVSTWGVTAVEDGFDGKEWFGLLGAVATALGVAAASNEAPLTDPYADADERGLTLIELLVGGFVLILLFLLLVTAVDGERL